MGSGATPSLSDPGNWPSLRKQDSVHGIPAVSLSQFLTGMSSGAGLLGTESERHPQPAGEVGRRAPHFKGLLSPSVLFMSFLVALNI